MNKKIKKMIYEIEFGVLPLHRSTDSV